jgi:hypothetical protein
MDYFNIKFGSDSGYPFHSYIVEVKLFVVKKWSSFYSNLWMVLVKVEK